MLLLLRSWQLFISATIIITSIIITIILTINNIIPVKSSTIIDIIIFIVSSIISAFINKFTDQIVVVTLVAKGGCSCWSAGRIARFLFFPLAWDSVTVWRRDEFLPLLEKGGFKTVSGGQAINFVSGHQLLHRLQYHTQSEEVECVVS